MGKMKDLALAQEEKEFEEARKRDQFFIKAKQGELLTSPVKEPESKQEGANILAAPP